MHDLSRIKKNKKGYYIEYIVKNGKRKGYVIKMYGEFRICRICHEKNFVTNNDIQKGFGEFGNHSCSAKAKCWFYGKHQTGKLNPNWKGGKRYNNHGYILIKKPNHPCSLKDGYIFEHRLVMEKHLKRYLKPEERVHHINGIRDDNRIENLELFKNDKEHGRIHMIGENNLNWRGGKKHNRHDYVLIYKPNHPNCNRTGYIRKSRLVMEKHLGRYLKPREIVHHKDGNKTNDRIENLMLFKSRAKHMKFHWKKYL